MDDITIVDNSIAKRQAVIRDAHERAEATERKKAEAQKQHDTSGRAHEAQERVPKAPQSRDPIEPGRSYSVSELASLQESFNDQYRTSKKQLEKEREASLQKQKQLKADRDDERFSKMWRSLSRAEQDKLFSKMTATSKGPRSPEEERKVTEKIEKFHRDFKKSIGRDNGDKPPPNLSLDGLSKGTVKARVKQHARDKEPAQHRSARNRDRGR